MPEKLSRGEYRHIRQGEQAERFLDQMEGVEIIFQVGLGDWPEGPALYHSFPHARFYAVEPLQRFRKQAADRGYQGILGSYVVWDVSGKQISLGDRRTKTSVFCQEFRKGSDGVIVRPSITLDDLLKVWSIPFRKTLLWLDCEGAELHVLRGGPKFLMQTAYVVCELRDDPPFPGWATKGDIIRRLDLWGFEYVDHAAKDGLFVATGGVW